MGIRMRLETTFLVSRPCWYRGRLFEQDGEIERLGCLRRERVVLLDTYTGAPSELYGAVDLISTEAVMKRLGRVHRRRQAVLFGLDWLVLFGYKDAASFQSVSASTLEITP